MASLQDTPARKILLTGGTGQVGSELLRFLGHLGEVTAPGSSDLDLTQPERIREAVRDIRPHLIVNAAAYAAVDRAEEERDLAMALNGSAPKILAEEARALKAAMVHYSTDYVFDGSKDGSYLETDEINPINVYGITKASGDAAVQKASIPHLIFRTSWVYGLTGKNFLLTLQRLAGEKDELGIVNDQCGAPTWSRLIAQTTANILDQTLSSTKPADMSQIGQASGIYNMTCSGQTSWFGFAEEILKGLPDAERLKLMPIPTSDYPTPARRPLNSVLSNGKLRDTFGILPPDWQGVLNFCLKDLAPT